MPVKKPRKATNIESTYTETPTEIATQNSVPAVPPPRREYHSVEGEILEKALACGYDEVTIAQKKAGWITKLLDLKYGC